MIKAMKEVLDYLREPKTPNYKSSYNVGKLVANLDQAVKEYEDAKPVAIYFDHFHDDYVAIVDDYIDIPEEQRNLYLLAEKIVEKVNEVTHPLYTHPPHPQTNTRLSDDVIRDAIRDARTNWDKEADDFNKWDTLDDDERSICIAKAIEAKLRG